MRLAILAAIILLLAGCANPNHKRNKQVFDRSIESLRSCMSQTTKGKSAECAQNFHSSLLSVSDDDYGKLPALRMATALYALLVKVDRGQISGSDAQIQWMQISTDLQVDLNEAQRRSIAENRAAALQQQQLFMNAQRLLSPPGSTINCYRAPGSFVTTCY
jgi:hypothetical protein